MRVVAEASVRLPNVLYNVWVYWIDNVEGKGPDYLAKRTQLNAESVRVPELDSFSPDRIGIYITQIIRGNPQILEIVAKYEYPQSNR